MATPLLVLAVHPAPGMDVLGSIVTAGPFGVGKSLAVLVAVAAFLIGAMVLGGYVGGTSRRRKNRRKRH